MASKATPGKLLQCGDRQPPAASPRYGRANTGERPDASRHLGRSESAKANAGGRGLRPGGGDGGRAPARAGRGAGMVRAGQQSGPRTVSAGLRSRGGLSPSGRGDRHLQPSLGPAAPPLPFHGCHLCHLAPGPGGGAGQSKAGPGCGGPGEAWHDHDQPRAWLRQPRALGPYPGAGGGA